jgi:hypothetical protein
MPGENFGNLLVSPNMGVFWDRYQWHSAVANDGSPQKENGTGEKRLFPPVLFSLF